MERCFICCNELDNSTIYLPMVDEYFSQNISIFKNTFIIKDINDFKFLYYCVCSPCINNYLKYHGKLFNYIRNCELGNKYLNKNTT